MKSVYIIILIIVFSILAFVAYVATTIKKLTYDFKIKSFLPKGGDPFIVNIMVDVIVNNPLFFSIPVKYLYYEIYYNGGMLGKSKDSSGFILAANGQTIIPQSIDLFLEKNNLGVATNYLAKVPTTYTAKVYVNVIGINLKLKDLEFTY